MISAGLVNRSPRGFWDTPSNGVLGWCGWLWGGDEALEFGEPALNDNDRTPRRQRAAKA